jgi:aspartate oxidase
VITGGLAPMRDTSTSMNPRTFLQKIYAAGAKAHFDAVGESACTGLHGANRLASNSLAECFVFGSRAALAARFARAEGR